MKAILVIDDMPKTCNECPLMAWDDEDNWLGCYLTKRQTGIWSAQAGKPVDCPLKPLPQFIWHEEGKENECEEWYRNGWNECLEEIEK